MPYRICRTFEIESGHMLSKHPDRCRFPHGHSRRVEVVLEAHKLNASDMVCDYKALKEALNEYLDSFDHAMCVNSEDPRYAELKAAYGERIITFDHVDPTTEVMARTLFDACVNQLARYQAAPDARYPIGDGVRVLRVRVWETASTWAEFEA